MPGSPARLATEHGMTDLHTPDSDARNPRNPGGELTDTSDMFLPHTVFRREFRLAAKAVRRVPPGDTEQAAYAADMLTFVVEALTHHHQNEDALLWPRLHERAPKEVEPIVDLMEDQHEHIHEVLVRAQRQLDTWQGDPSEANREALAGTMEEAYAALDEHLAAEEQQILPIAARHVSAEEWEEMAERGMEWIPKDKQLLALGSMRYSAPPEVFARKVAPDLPRLLRPFLLRMADRKFRQVALRLHGTATP